MSCIFCGTKNANEFTWGWEVAGEICEGCLDPRLKAWLEGHRKKVAEVAARADKLRRLQQMDVEMSWPRRRARLLDSQK